MEANAVLDGCLPCDWDDDFENVEQTWDARVVRMPMPSSSAGSAAGAASSSGGAVPPPDAAERMETDNGIIEV